MGGENSQRRLWEDRNKSLGGTEYFVIFIDEKSTFAWVYVMKHKSEVFQKSKEGKAIMEKST